MHKERSWGEESVKKILDRKIWYFGQKSKNSTKILVIFNNFSRLHLLCDFCKNYFFGDLEHSENNLDQNFFRNLKKKFDPDFFKRVQGHQKNSFYRIHITNVTLKNYWKWPKFLSNFSIFGRNIEFFGPKFFSQILYPKTFLCAKN